MIDLLMNESGDIVLQEVVPAQNHRLKIDFAITPTKPVVFSFFIDCPHIKEVTAPLYTFYIGEEHKTFKEASITDKEALRQQAEMLLRTALKEISHDETYGSELEKIKHNLKPSTDFLHEAEVLAEKALSELIPEAIVKAKFIKNKKGVCKISFEIQTFLHTLNVDWEE